jgi:hypothetical protein
MLIVPEYDGMVLTLTQSRHMLEIEYMYFIEMDHITPFRSVNKSIK